MHVLQKTCSHGKIRSAFRSKQMQHSIEDGSSASDGLMSVTFVSKFGIRRAYNIIKKCENLSEKNNNKNRSNYY